MRPFRVGLVQFDASECDGLAYSPRQRVATPTSKRGVVFSEKPDWDWLAFKLLFVRLYF